MGDRNCAEAACVEAFERAHNGLASFNGRAAFGTWLYRIVANTCKTHLRRRSREQSRWVPLRSAVDVASGSSAPPRDALLEKEIRQEVTRAVKKLPPKLRLAWLLYASEGMKLAEIARLEQCSVGAVKSRLFHARRRLQDELSDYLEGSVG